jgi:hypothetical protein
LPGASSTANNEDATAPLWNSEVLSVQNPVGGPIPELPQRPEEGAKSPSSVDGQDAGHVFPNDPPRLQSSSQRQKLKREVAARIVQPRALSGD